MAIFLVIVLATSPVWAQAPAAPAILPAPGAAAPSPTTTPQLPPGKTQFAGSGKTETPSTGPVTACAPGPTQAQCLQKLAQAQGGQKDQGGMDKAMPILNALSQMFGGNSSEVEPEWGSERMARTGGDAGGNGDYAPAGPYILARELKAQGGRGTAAIVPPFQKWFDVCTEKVGLGICKFKFLGIWGDANHMKRKSCHNSGEALDAGFPFDCTVAGKVVAESSQAMDVAKCLATQTGNAFGIIFRNQTPVPNMSRSSIDPHLHHIHVKVRSCRY